MKAGYLVVMLLPNDKSTQWYNVIHKNASEVIEIIGGRIAFINPVTGEENKNICRGSLVAVFNPFIQWHLNIAMPLAKIKEIGDYVANEELKKAT